MTKIPARNIFVGLNATESESPNRKKSSAPPPSPEGCFRVLGVIVSAVIATVINEKFGVGAIVAYGFFCVGLLIYFLIRDKRKKQEDLYKQEKKRQQELDDFNNYVIKKKEESIRLQAIHQQEADTFIKIYEERQREIDEEKRKIDEQRRSDEYWRERAYMVKQQSEKYQIQKAALRKASTSEIFQSTCGAVCSDCPREKQGLPCLDELEKERRSRV